MVLAGSWCRSFSTFSATGTLGYFRRGGLGNSFRRTAGGCNVGATLGVTKERIGEVLETRQFARRVFGLGAFDLSRRVRTSLKEAEPTTALLSRLLEPSEREELARGPDNREDFDSWILSASISDLEALGRRLAGKTFVGRIAHARSKERRTSS